MDLNRFPCKTDSRRFRISKCEKGESYNRSSYIFCMETLIDALPFTVDQSFEKKRKMHINALQSLLAVNKIDEPVQPLMKKCARLPHCFTLQCCYGHFLHEFQRDEENFEPVSAYREINTPIEFRISYIAWCIEASDLGRKLYDDLQAIISLDPAYIQFGSAQWFWNRCVNSYVLQVEPERDKEKDKTYIDYKEAVHIEQIRNTFFDAIEDIIDDHIMISSRT